MKLKGIDETQLIKRLTSRLKKDSTILKGVGDDSAVIKYKKNTYLLITTDILIEDVHFKIKKTKPELIGHKALACNISDIAAMGGKPKYAVISLGLPRDLDLNFADAIFKGIRKEAILYGIKIVGGDISSSSKVIINITLIGFAKKKNLTFRDTAKVGDKIFVTGKLGGSQRGKHLSFRPRLNEALSLIRKYKINSMIDLSDGLAQDLNNIIQPSKVGALIYEDKIPLSKDADINSALYEGEDFELLFTTGKEESKKIEVSKIKGLKVTKIGEIVNKSKRFKIIDKDKKAKDISLRYTFKHF